MTFGHYLSPEATVFMGHNLGILGGGLVAVFAGLTWIRYQSESIWPRATVLFIFLTIVAWTYQIIRMYEDKDAFNFTVLITPAALLLILLKPVSRADLKVALLFLAYSLASIGLLSLVLGEVGVIPSGFNASDAGGQTRFAPLGFLGIETRWGGPWGSVNRASPMGGLILIIGAVHRGWHRVALMAAGLIILILGGSRTSLFAVLAALMVVFLTVGGISRLRYRNYIRAFAIGLFSALAFAYVWVFDPTLALRTPIWSYFIQAIPQNPMMGLGESGLSAYVGSLSGGQDFYPHTDAHNVYLDLTVRYGLVMTVITFLILFIGGMTGIKALKRGYVAPIGLFTYVSVAALGETLFSWTYWSAYLVVLLWSVLYGSLLLQGQDQDNDRELLPARSD